MFECYGVFHHSLGIARFMRISKLSEWLYGSSCSPMASSMRQTFSRYSDDIPPRLYCVRNCVNVKEKTKEKMEKGKEKREKRKEKNNNKQEKSQKTAHFS